MNVSYETRMQSKTANFAPFAHHLLTNHWLVPFPFHIDYIIKKATARLYFLKQLKKAGLSSSHLIHFYITVIRPVLEYCAPAWHCALTKAQSESLEAIQKRAIHITHNLTRGMPYSSMLYCANLDSLASRREDLSRRLLRVDLITLAGLKRPSVRTSVRPSTKSFFDFNEIWCVGRGRQVMHDGMQYDPILWSRSRSRAHESNYFQGLSPPPFTMGAGKWPRILKLRGNT